MTHVASASDILLKNVVMSHRGRRENQLMRPEK